MTSERSTQQEYGIRPPGFRLPDDLRLGAVLLQVADIERSLTYYTTVLGMNVVERTAESAILGDATRSPLVELRERPGVRPVPRSGRLGLYHFAILLPDRPSLGRFLSHLAHAGVRAGMSDHLVSEAIYLSDPDGLGIEVYVDRNRDSWVIRGSELAMATEPLDSEAVIAAGADGEWQGMPAGTRIGHVHLFVADLAAAAEFYHESLGLDKIVWSYPGALFMSAGGYHHHLGVNTWAAGAPRATDGDARLLEWRIELPEAEGVGELGESLSSRGFMVDASAKGLLTRDPWGTTLRVTAGNR
jgi:catechol 2,3-dioxygenase